MRRGEATASGGRLEEVVNWWGLPSACHPSQSLHPLLPLSLSKCELDRGSSIPPISPVVLPQVMGAAGERSRKRPQRSCTDHPPSRRAIGIGVHCPASPAFLCVSAYTLSSMLRPTCYFKEAARWQQGSGWNKGCVCSLITALLPPLCYRPSCFFKNWLSKHVLKKWPGGQRGDGKGRDVSDAASSGARPVYRLDYKHKILNTIFTVYVTTLCLVLTLCFVWPTSPAVFSGAYFHANLHCIKALIALASLLNAMLKHETWWKTVTELIGT